MVFSGGESYLSALTGTQNSAERASPLRILLCYKRTRCPGTLYGFPFSYMRGHFASSSRL